MKYSELRPSRQGKEIIRATVSGIMNDVVAWLADPSVAHDEIIDDLTECYSSDGYEFARNLENKKSWDCDSDLVEILNGCSTFVPYETACKAWVERNGVVVPFAKGDKVLARSQIAIVVDIRHATATVVVQPVEPDGRNYGETSGWIHAFEELRPAP